MFAESKESAVQQAARQLRRWGVGGPVAALLTHGGPLAFWGAQALYAATPVLSVFDDGAGLHQLAAVLEDPAAAEALAAALTAPAAGAGPA
jgi:hypothetical protein